MATTRHLEDPPAADVGAEAMPTSARTLPDLGITSTICAAAGPRACRSSCASTRCAGSRGSSSLLVLDAAGVYAALLSTLELKSTLRGGATLSENASQAYHYATFSIILTVLLFARSGLYADRASRPGLRAVVSSLLPVTRRGVPLREGRRPGVLQLLHLLGLADRRRLHHRRAALVLRQHQRRPAARRRLPPPRGARRDRPAHRVGRARARRRAGHRVPDRRRGLHLADAAPGQRDQVARAAERPERRHRARADRRGDHRRPRVPAAGGGRARRRVPPPRRARADRAVDDGDPRPPRRLRPR